MSYSVKPVAKRNTVVSGNKQSQSTDALTKPSPHSLGVIDSQIHPGWLGRQVKQGRGTAYFPLADIKACYNVKIQPKHRS